MIVKGWGYWIGGEYLPIRRGVVLDVDWLSDRLEGVSETEKDLRGFREVFHAGGRGR
jgi:hypothetical protein